MEYPFPSVLAILCGVAVGLTSVAVAVILVVRNRSGGLAGEEAREGDVGGSGGSSSGESGGGGGDGRGKYDAVSTKEGGDRQMARCGELRPASVSRSWNFDVIRYLWSILCLRRLLHLEGACAHEQQ